MPKVFLHIGPHKTGSTYIQKALYDNSEQLQSLGVHYPRLGLSGQYGHHELVERVQSLDAGSLARYISNFIAPTTTFLSSENFDRLTAAEIDKLSVAIQEVLGSQATLAIIYYHRNWIDLLPSFWQEDVKHGAIASFPEFMLPHVLRPFASKLINPALVLDLYAAAFGRERLEVVDYDTAKTDVLRPIFELLGLEIDVGATQAINTSLGVERVEILRALNSIARTRNQWHFHKTRTLFLEHCSDAEIAEDLEKLAALIHEHLHSMRLASDFIEKSVRATFRSRYGSRFVNKPSIELPERELLVARDDWLIDGSAFCKRVYRHIIAAEPGP